MKRYILLACLVLVSVVGQLRAQTSAGIVMIGGGFSFSSRSSQANSDYEDRSIGFSPSVGYFVNENLAVGLNLGVESNTFDNGATKTVTSSFSFGPFARYYKFIGGENFAFFGQAAFNISSGKTDVTPGGETKSGNIYFAASPGLAYFFTKNWALDLSFQGLTIGSYDPNKDVDDDKFTDINFGVNSLTPTFGVRYHF